MATTYAPATPKLLAGTEHFNGASQFLAGMYQSPQTGEFSGNQKQKGDLLEDNSYRHNGYNKR
ncbi:MAG: hypothetical protein MK165_06480 [Pirellulaceae bacterium]|nr:hypothetical protein [Pirellulaceae bacterium]